MPYFPQTLPAATLPPVEMISVQGGVVAMGSSRLDARWENCMPCLVQVDSFSIAPTCVTVGFQRQVMEGGRDEAPDNYPGLFSLDDNVVFASKLSLLSGRLYGIGTEAEWEYAARDFVPDADAFMEAHQELNIKGRKELRDWLVEERSWLENPVVLTPGEALTLHSRLVTDLAPDLRSPEALKILEEAPRIGLWTVFSGIGDLDSKRHYFNQSGRGPVGYGQPSSKGLYDMTGGMWEWCADVYRQDAHNLPQANPFNAPEGPEERSTRVQRGGSWSNVDRDILRLADRDCNIPGWLDSDCGARLFGPAQDSKAV